MDNSSHHMFAARHSLTESPMRHSWLRPAPEVTQKVGTTTASRWLSANKSEVTPKVGSVEGRDYSVRKPMLKIGQTHGHNFIDTYSIA